MFYVSNKGAKQMREFTFYNDPGHGWIMVTDDDLKAVDLKPSMFSAGGQYVQRQSGQRIFLEEDCDAPQFLRAWEAKFGKPTLKDVYLNHRSEMRIR
jgi:hypothetical protein